MRRLRSAVTGGSKGCALHPGVPTPRSICHRRGYDPCSDNPMGLTNPRDDNPSFPGKHTNQQTKQPSANKSIHRGNIAIQNKHTNIVGK